MTIATLVLLLLGLAAFTVCQWLLPGLTRSPQSAWFLRALLFFVGLALGLMYASHIPETDSMRRLLLVVTAVGMVHIPAAAILLIKRASHRRP